MILAAVIIVVILIIRVFSSMSDREGYHYQGRGRSRAAYKAQPRVPAREQSARKTYAVFGILAGLSRDKVCALFEGHGFVPVRSLDDSYATIVWSSQEKDYKFDPRSFHMKCQVKNLLDIKSHEVISNKEYLHLAIAQRDPHAYETHFARTWRLRDFRFPDAGGVFIIRPTTVGFFGGKGIFRITNRIELKAVVDMFEKDRIAEHSIVSEYFDDPYLFYQDGRKLKFHLRMYFMVRENKAGIPFWELFGLKDEFAETAHTEHTRPRAKILTADKPYEHGDYDNREIHDTHAKSTKGAIFFPTHAGGIRSPDNKSLDMKEVIWQLRVICDALGDLVTKPKPVRPYEESTRGFEIFGLDIMIIKRQTATGIIDPCVVLLEVNDRVGYDTPPDYLFDEMQDDYLEWTWANGFAPLLSS
jgi:hypothetical protein